MKYIGGLLTELGIKDMIPSIFVHSPYTNLKTIEYLAKEGQKTQVVKTGVKNAHPIVHSYAIGANDEPNGHGTVAYKEDEIMAVLK